MAEEKKMKKKSMALFGEHGVRREWDAEEEKWWFSVIDVVGVLTDQPNARGATLYWSKLKQRLKEEGDELLTNCQQRIRFSTFATLHKEFLNLFLNEFYHNCSSL